MPAKAMVGGAHPPIARWNRAELCAPIGGASNKIVRYSWCGLDAPPLGIRVGDALSAAACRRGRPTFFNTPVSVTQLFDTGSGVFRGIFPNLAGKALGVGHAAGAGLVFT